MFLSGYLPNMQVESTSKRILTVDEANEDPIGEIDQLMNEYSQQQKLVSIVLLRKS